MRQYKPYLIYITDQHIYSQNDLGFGELTCLKYAAL